MKCWCASRLNRLSETTAQASFHQVCLYPMFGFPSQQEGTDLHRAQDVPEKTGFYALCWFGGFSGKTGMPRQRSAWNSTSPPTAGSHTALREEERQGKRGKDGGSSAVQNDLRPGRMPESIAQTSGQKGDCGKDQRCSQKKESAQPDDLQPEWTASGSRELGQKGEKKNRHLGVGDVHENTPAIQAG